MNVSSHDTEVRVANADFAYPWVPDQGDGMYRNPILYADYSDPDAIRHGDDFFMTASSFNCTPGLPILHSRDLVNWKLIGHAVKNLPHPRYAEVQPGCGIWAPSIRFHAGRFWIFFPMPDEGIYVTTAQNPAGPWSEPHLLEAGKGLIDPCPLWDDDGKAYLVHAYAQSRSGIRHMLRVRPMAPDGSKLLGEGQIVFHAPERHPTMEGPKFLKKDGWYYILAPAGGVESGWQVVLRSKNIYGPYEDKIVLERGSTAINGPHQGAMVDLANGEWWFLHFQDAGLYGRVVHMQPVNWKDGWPLMGEDLDGNGVGEPVSRQSLRLLSSGGPKLIPQTSDEFESSALGLQWQWHANHRVDWFSLPADPGWLRLKAQHVAEANLQKAPNLLTQKFPARSFQTKTLLRFSPMHHGDEAGVVIAGRSSAALAIRMIAGKHQLIFRKDDSDTIVAAIDSDRVWIQTTVHDGGKVRFRYSTNGSDFSVVPYEFQAVVGVWIGAKIGIYCISRNGAPGGHADFDYFRFAPAE